MRRTRRPSPGGEGFSRVVWPLAIAETLVWAAMFYSFPALLLEWERDLGWSKTELSGAFTLALGMSAVCAPIMGRFIDRGFGRYILAGSALTGAALLLVLATVTTLWQFYLVWFFLGVAMAGSLYEPCFAFLTRVMGDRSRQAITLVTLVAGFAGAVAFPGTYVLLTMMDWRGTVFVLALVTAFVAVPLFWISCRHAESSPRVEKLPVSRTSTYTATVMRQATFWFLAIAFAMVALDHGLIITHLLPMLDERGISSDTAVLAASMVGPMQVAGRLAMMAAEKHVSVLTIAIICLLAMGSAAIALLGSGSIAILLVIFVIFQGAGYGVTSIVRPVLISELLGRMNFGLIAGYIAVPFLVASAAAPTIAALIWQVGGYNLVIWVAAGACVTGLASLLAAARFSHPGQAKT